jgi:hypothetical protein
MYCAHHEDVPAAWVGDGGGAPTAAHSWRYSSLELLLLLCPVEISQIRVRLIFAGRYQVAVDAHEIVLLVDDDVPVVFGAVVVVPDDLADRGGSAC